MSTSVASPPRAWTRSARATVSDRLKAAAAPSSSITAAGTALPKSASTGLPRARTTERGTPQGGRRACRPRSRRPRSIAEGRSPDGHRRCRRVRRAEERRGDEQNGDASPRREPERGLVGHCDDEPERKRDEEPAAVETERLGDELADGARRGRAAGAAAGHSISG